VVLERGLGVAVCSSVVAVPRLFQTWQQNTPQLWLAALSLGFSLPGAFLGLWAILTEQWSASRCAAPPMARAAMPTLLAFLSACVVSRVFPYYTGEFLQAIEASSESS